MNPKTRSNFHKTLEIIDEQRTFALARLASSVSHKLGTPLQIIHGHAFLMQDNDKSELGKHITEIVEQSNCISRTLREVLDFLRLPENEPYEAEIYQSLTETVDELRGLLAECNTEINLSSLIPHTPIVLHWAEWKWAIRELFFIVLRRMEPETTLTLGLHCIPVHDNQLISSMSALEFTLSGCRLTGEHESIQPSPEPWFASNLTIEQSSQAFDWLGLIELVRRRGAQVDIAAEHIKLMWPCEET